MQYLYDLRVSEDFPELAVVSLISQTQGINDIVSVDSGELYQGEQSCASCDPVILKVNPDNVLNRESFPDLIYD